MKAVLQRVLSAKVTVADKTVGETGKGLVVLLGVAKGDGKEEAALLASKTAQMRIFPNEQGKMSLSLKDIGGQALVVPNFTLCADCRHGRRPDFIGAARPEPALELFRTFAELLGREGVAKVGTGRFGADMKLEIVCDGPVTIVLDTDLLR